MNSTVVVLLIYYLILMANKAQRVKTFNCTWVSFLGLSRFLSCLCWPLCFRLCYCYCCCCYCCGRPHSKFKNLYLLLLLFLVKKLLSLNVPLVARCALLVARCDYLGIENRHKSSWRHFDKENQLIHCNRNGIFASLIYRAKA